MQHPRRLLTALTVVTLAATLAACGPETTSGDSPNRVSSGELVERSAANDGKSVDFTGEAIGEAMIRGDMAWLHLNDDAYYLSNSEENGELHGYNSGMPVYLPAELARKVDFFGGHRHQGDVVTVRGTFNATCVLHGGDTDIHADSLTRVAPGRRVAHAIETWKLVLALGLSLLVLVLWQVERVIPPEWERENPGRSYRPSRLRKR